MFDNAIFKRSFPNPRYLTQLTCTLCDALTHSNTHPFLDSPLPRFTHSYIQPIPGFQPTATRFMNLSSQPFLNTSIIMSNHHEIHPHLDSSVSASKCTIVFSIPRFSPFLDSTHSQRHSFPYSHVLRHTLPESAIPIFSHPKPIPC